MPTHHGYYRVQDGAYLADLLLQKGYIVHGIKRRSSSLNTARIDYLYRVTVTTLLSTPLFLHYGDMTDSTNLMRLLGEEALTRSTPRGAEPRPGELRDAGSTRPTPTPWARSVCSRRSATAHGRRCPLYQASTSELFGKVEMQRELDVAVLPTQPLRGGQALCLLITVNYREAYGMCTPSNGILFNHESPIRGETFVTRRSRAVAAIERGLPGTALSWQSRRQGLGHARDYVEGMWRILQEQPDDYVLATGETQYTSVREFVELRLRPHRPAHRMARQGRRGAGLPAHRKGSAAIDGAYRRPTEVDPAR